MGWSSCSFSFLYLKKKSHILSLIFKPKFCDENLRKKILKPKELKILKVYIRKLLQVCPNA